MPQTVKILDKSFKVLIHRDKISKAVKSIAKNITSDLKNSNPLFLIVLNGAFIFAADLLKEISFPCEISFIKVSSYKGTQQAKEISQLIGMNESVVNRTVVVVEDIVDSGNTIEKIYKELKSKKAKDIKIACALFKPDAYKKNYSINYTGIKIENDFVVGYGLDYLEQGRNLKDIYVLKK